MPLVAQKSKPCENFFPLELVVTWSLIDFACTLPPPSPPTQAYCPSPMTPDMHAAFKTVLYGFIYSSVQNCVPMKTDS